MEQKSANLSTQLAQIAHKRLTSLASSMGMVGPEGLEPPTKRL